MQPSFMLGFTQEFRRVFKRDFYAWLYGNAKARLLMQDLRSAYLMGEEL